MDITGVNHKPINLEMKTDHVAIEMEEKPLNNNWKVIQMNEDIKKSKEDMKPRSSLKSYYLGCSCVICYRRYKCSKKPHSCNANDRCHVEHKERIQDLGIITLNSFLKGILKSS